ncbi:NAD(P)-binding protein [Daldinia decipiens]|uniref:NAD(P)-binding protein n=1 Tax=Daldinia decipiens TaxID=326647 RepID=UPI0020C42C1A|nr:NAD(P)-binding protein [Daldinia decipiens]KAI1659678.1 NAD(P)-binding protein [Daldinia decipiens]
MDATGKQILYTAIATLLVIGIAWIWKLNSALKQTPPEVLAVSPHRWTEQEIKDTYRRIEANPIDWVKQLPPRLNRRYIVTGGCGGVGGQIVLHLLARGQSPESIRIVDFQKPVRSDLITGSAALVDFAQADITSPPATSAAFNKPWPKSVAHLPLTVFHTAAIIQASERSLKTYEHVKRVNVDGVQNVLDASKQAGADVFVSTSSASVAYMPVRYWNNPFQRWPENYWQVLDDSDFDRPLRPHAQFFSNYAYAKATGERLISEANNPSFRTGLVRPGNGIYGSSHGDQIIGLCLRAGTFPSWTRNIIQNFAHAGNVSLAHLLFEAALLRDEKIMPKCAGRAFTVTDAGPPPIYDDVYKLLRITATANTAPIKVMYLQPGIMLCLAHIIEWFDLASRTPVLEWIVPRPKGELAKLQPAIFTPCSHLLASNEGAGRSIDEGGIGYRPVHNTIEGVCQQVLEWNIEHQDSAKQGPQSSAETFVKEIKNVGVMPTAMGA